MYRQDQRSGQPSEQKVGHLEVSPVVVGVSPTHGQNPIEVFPPSFLGPVTQDGEIGNHPHVPEKHRHRKVGGDGEHVPFQGTPELRPDGIGVRKWKQPPCKPYATHVEERKDAGAHDRKNSHGFGTTIDGGSPFLLEKAKDGRDQGAGVTNANPENEIDDCPTPVDRVVVTPHPNPGGNQIHQTHSGKTGDNHCGDEAPPPPSRGFALDDSANFFSDPMKASIVQDERLIMPRRRLDPAENLWFVRD